MKHEISRIAGISILFVAQFGALTGCSEEPPEQVECDNPCQPDIALSFAGDLPEGEHQMVLSADEQVIECTFKIGGGQLENADCGDAPVSITEDGIYYWESPKTLDVKLTLPDGCSASASYSPTYDVWHDVQCDVTCSESEDTFDFSECLAVGMGGGGAGGGEH